MKTLSLTTRLRLMALLLTLAMLGLAAYTALAFYESSIGQRLSTTRAVVTQALGTVQKYQTEATAGKISEAEAKAKAKAELMAMRYEGKEYVFITDVTAHMVAHPIKPEMDGTDQTNTKDPKGKQLFVEMANVVKAQGSGYVDYLWPRVGSDEPVPKRSYVAGFTPWGWVVGSGVYIDAVRNDALRFAGVTLAISLVVCALIFVFIHRFAGSLQRRFQQAETALSAIAAGDLTVDVPIGRLDEIGRMMQTLCSTRDRLAQVMAQVRDATGNVGAASGEIALGNQDLSTRTEATAANLQRTAGSMSLLTTTVNRSTEAAEQASREAGSATEVAQRGGQVVSEVVTTMQNIQDSSNRISEIIGTIDGIAFQTNILALNAAVEAARAGEQGKGFAVVASEVRSLAQRSAAAAREIKTLIVTSAERVECGARLVGSAGSTMSEIVGRVQRVTEMINGISAASNEQSRSLGEIAGAVQQLDEVTQQNAALVEESAAAAQSLRDQSLQLSAAVGRFQLPA